MRRQHPLHPYIADFFVASRRLVIEIDGGARADVTRDLVAALSLVRDALRARQ